MNVHPIGQQPKPPANIMQGGVSPMMQASPQPQGQQQGQIMASAGTPQQSQMSSATPQQPQQQAEKLDNISKVKSLLAPLRESLFLTIRTGAFALQQNNFADNLVRDTPKRENVTHPQRFEKHLEDFVAYCDQMELHLKTATTCMQQLSSAQHYLPNVVAPSRTEPYIQDNPGTPMPYPTYLNTTRQHIQSAKDIHDTLISAAQNISQAE